MRANDKQETSARGARRFLSRGTRWVGKTMDRLLPAGLSLRLLILTAVFVLLSEILIYVPSIANHRHEVFMRRLEAAQLAALSLEAAEDENIAVDLTEELLANAEAVSVILKRDERRSLFLTPGQLPPVPVERFDLENEGVFESIGEAFATLWRDEDRLISVRGVPRFEGGISIEAVIYEAPIREELWAYSQNILQLSIMISVLTAGLVYSAIHFLLVRPMQTLQRSMTAFRESPEDAGAIIVASDRHDEVGTAERELQRMQGDLRLALGQKARLAALGTAVSKINHDLRNMLASAQLFVDRLEHSQDPQVQRLAPKLVGAIDRAVNLCTNTLRFGKAEETAPQLKRVHLRRVADDVGVAAVPEADGPIRFRNQVEADVTTIADADQIFRVLLNLARNAAQAIESAGGNGEVTIAAFETEEATVIEVRDTGPGIPERARERLFQPFSSSQRAGGTGLGLAIAAELVRGHGGTIELAATGKEGTVFRIHLPVRKEIAA